MDSLTKTLDEVDGAADRLTSHLRWCGENRNAEKIQQLANWKHQPSVNLLAHFKLWMAVMELIPKDFVEATHKMATHFDDYRKSGYID